MAEVARIAQREPSKSELMATDPNSVAKIIQDEFGRPIPRALAELIAATTDRQRIAAAPLLAKADGPAEDHAHSLLDLAPRGRDE